MDELNLLRNEINNCDKQIMNILENRMNIAKKIGQVKAKNKMEVLCLGREKKVLDNLISQNQLPQEMITELWNIIFKYSKKNQIN